MAFKLSELFVEIQAKDQPFQATMAVLKTQAIATGDSIGHSMGDKIITGLVDKVPIVGTLLNKALGYFGTSTGDLIDMAVQQGMEHLPDLVSQLDAMATETFPGLKESALSYADSFLQAFGSSALTGVEDVNSAITSIRETITETGAIITESWDLLLRIGWVKWRTFGENIGEVIGTMAANAVQVGEYIANNWVKLLTDAANAIVLAFKNVGTYLSELGSSIVKFLKDPSKGFKAPEWKGLLDSFKATADKLPEVLQFVWRDAQPEIDKLMEEMGERAAKRKEAKPPEEEPAAAEAAMADKFKASLEAVGSFRTKAILGIYGGDKDKIPADQLAEAKKANKHLEKIAEKKPVAALG